MRDTSQDYQTEKLGGVAFPMYLTKIAHLAKEYAAIVLLGLFVSPATAGAYFAAERLAGLAGLSKLIVGAVTSAEFSAKHAAGDLGKLQQAAIRAVHGSFWPSVIVALMMLLFGEQLLSLFGREFTQATPVLWILVAAHVFAGAVGSVSNLLNMTGHHSRVTLVTIATAVLHIILISQLLTRYGAVGAAVATLATTIVSSLWLLHFVRRDLHIRPTIIAASLQSADKKQGSLDSECR